MKRFSTGLLLGLALGTAVTVARASVEIQLSPITVRDFYAGFALCGKLAAKEPDSQVPVEVFRIADEMIRHRR